MFSLCHYGVFCAVRWQKTWISSILNSGCNATKCEKVEGCEYFLKALWIYTVCSPTNTTHHFTNGNTWRLLFIDTPPSNLTELEQICKEEWEKIPKSRCAKLIDVPKKTRSCNHCQRRFCKVLTQGVEYYWHKTFQLFIFNEFVKNSKNMFYFHFLIMGYFMKIGDKFFLI